MTTTLFSEDTRTLLIYGMVFFAVCSIRVTQNTPFNRYEKNVYVGVRDKIEADTGHTIVSRPIRWVR